MTLSHLVAPFGAFAVLAAAFAYASWKAALAPDPARPRLFPWRTLSVLFGAAGLIALIYLIARALPADAS